MVSTHDPINAQPADPVTDYHGFIWRIVNLLSLYRVLICAVLLAIFYALPNAPLVGAHDRHLFVLTILVYLFLSVIGWLARDRERPQILSQLQWMLLIDIFAIVLLMHASGGIRSGIGNLLIVSMGATALAMQQRSSLVFAALGAIAILIEQIISRYEQITTVSDFTPTGVLGATIFIIALVAYPIAQRLRESEELAARRGVDLANLNELNQYIIQHLRESIVVIDEHDQVRLMNSSAARLLGVELGNQPAPHLKNIAPELYQLAVSWRTDAQSIPSSYGTINSADGSNVITPHFAPIGSQNPSPTTIFLENTSELSERIQQTKLASLGRLSASIAHEIRNPVGAISHASQLLSEAPSLTHEDQRLTQIIEHHCERVSDIIDSVLNFSRRDHTRPEKIELNRWLKEFLEDYRSRLGTDANNISFESDEKALTIRIDPVHLQQVLWNLCENALRYGSTDTKPGFTIHSGRLLQNERPYLDVLDNGPGIDPDKVKHIFEPFFTHAADGTGLGLFIARELCECNGATLVYEPRNEGGSRFRIVFSDPARWSV